jgi:hypothetical protein
METILENNEIEIIANKLDQLLLEFENESKKLYESSKLLANKLDDIIKQVEKINTTKKTKSKKSIGTTETIGQSVEKAICLLLNIEYIDKKNTIYDENLIKYLLEDTNFVEKIKALNIIKYVGTNGNSTDFICANGIEISVKTNQNSSKKVCPQIIGQPTKKKFCEYFKLSSDLTNTQIKEYINNNYINMLKNYHNNLFNKKLLYIIFPKYNETNYEYSLQIEEPIPYMNIDIAKLSLKNTLDQWNESNTLKYNIGDNKTISIGEFQVHKNRDCIKFRFNMKNYLDVLSTIKK